MVIALRGGGRLADTMTGARALGNWNACVSLVFSDRWFLGGARFGRWRTAGPQMGLHGSVQIM